MKKILYLFFVFAILFSCKTKDTNTDKKEELKVLPGYEKKDIVVEGVIQKQSATTYQYGTHVLKAQNAFYALKSKNISLDKYLGKKVKVQGNLIPGYPIEGGPKYINVKKVILQ